MEAGTEVRRVIGALNVIIIFLATVTLILWQGHPLHELYYLFFESYCYVLSIIAFLAYKRFTWFHVAFLAPVLSHAYFDTTIHYMGAGRDAFWLIDLPILSLVTVLECHRKE